MISLKKPILIHNRLRTLLIVSIIILPIIGFTLKYSSFKNQTLPSRTLIKPVIPSPTLYVVNASKYKYTSFHGNKTKGADVIPLNIPINNMLDTLYKDPNSVTYNTSSDWLVKNKIELDNYKNKVILLEEKYPDTYSDYLQPLMDSVDQYNLSFIDYTGTQKSDPLTYFRDLGWNKRCIQSITLGIIARVVSPTGAIYCLQKDQGNYFRVIKLYIQMDGEITTSISDIYDKTELSYQ